MFSSELSVPAWSPLFRGHFDGKPILSGVAQLILLRELLRRHLPGREFANFDRIRFKQSAGPQETLRFEVSGPDDRGQLRIAIKREGSILTQGVLRDE